MNKQGNKRNPSGGIEWTHCFGPGTGYTSNPVRGCLHNCKWEMPDGEIAGCYAKDIAERFPKAYPNGFEHLSFHPEEFDAWKNLKAPSGIFCDSMSDLFGAQVPEEWIEQVLQAIADCPQHTFISLTKNPPRLQQCKRFPDNMWVGISAPPTFMFGQRLTKEQQIAWLRRGLQILGAADAAVKWISIEPLSFDISCEITELGKAINWAVIGAASNGLKTHQPDKHDFEMVLWALRTRQVFFKGNLSRELANEVAGGWREEFPDVTH